MEYKESVSASFARELVALANTLGGRILLGVRDDGTVAGINDSNELRARVQDIARNCDPPVRVLVEPVGNVMVVIVRESNAKPVQCREGFFWRQGAVTQKLSRDEIRDFFRSEGVIRFDLSANPGFRYPDDFDQDKFHVWLGLSRIRPRAAIEDILVNIEAAERSEGRLLFRNAGVLFFAREPRRFFNQAYITCLLFKGTARVDMLDRKDFSGGIVADTEDSLRFIERNTRTAYRIEKLQRENIPEYPVKAAPVSGPPTGQVTGEVTGVVTGEVTGEVHRLITVMEGEMKRQEIQAALGLKHEDHFRETYLVPALKAGVVEMTIPKKPRSSKQRYRITSKGKEIRRKLTDSVRNGR